MEINIAENIKTVELLKVEILQKVTDLFGDISAEADGETYARIADDAANLINLIYIIASRLGVSYEDIEDRIREKLAEGVREQHIIERKFGDLSKLLAVLGEGPIGYEKY